VTEFLQFAFLGLGAGAAYALLAHGVVLIYRGSGVVNFAHGALATVASYFCFVTLLQNEGWPIGFALAGGVVLGAAIAFLFELVVLRRLTHAAPIVRLVSTLGLLVMIQAVVQMEYGVDFVNVDRYLPQTNYDVGGVLVQLDRLILVGIAVVLTGVLWAFTRYHKLGLAITASAENERAVSSLGWSPHTLASFTWTVGGALAGLAGVLATNFTSGLNVTTFTLTVTIYGLAAALLGGFRSFPLTLAGGLLLGVGDSLLTRYSDDVRSFFGLHTLVGLNQALPFLVIVVVLVVRGRGLPLRSHIADRLPSLGSGIVRYPALLISLAATAVLALYVFDARWSQAVFVTLVAGIFILSIVVLTGFAGQLSLAQYALGGIAALAAAKLVAEEGWSTELAFLAGIVIAVAVGLLFAIPALRTRGVNLAVVTLGLGFAVSSMVFANGDYFDTTGFSGGTTIGTTKFFGIDVDAVDHPERWAIVCLIGFTLAVLVAANLRRSRSGRRLIAVRTNERAAASLGISVFGAKLYAFSVAAGIAAVGGMLLGFQSPTVTYSQFNAFASINAVAQAVIGGVGWVLGAVFGATLAQGSVGSIPLEDWLNLESTWLMFIGGAVLVVLLLVHPDGIADGTCRSLRDLRDKLRGKKASEPELLPEATLERVTPRTLEIDGLSVRFGGVTAVDGVTLAVNPGEIVGLIGPNGAGKTTLIDAATGFVKPAAGAIRLDGDPITSRSATWRARHGLRRSFQSLELFEDITVAENIHAGADESRGLSWLVDLVHPGKHPLPSTAVAAVRQFALAGDLAATPSDLPYGKRRLVGIARALASGPSVVLLDEPAAGLDSSESEELARLIRSLADERGMAILLVEHDVGLVMSICDRVVVLDFGRVIASGTPDEVRTDPAVLAAYLGELTAVHDEVVEGGVPT
jgi:ABC-type branched-subunit amino acid transport system ATPase component/ABC-type branched-subunit amino acid transport system permease subunit